MPDYERLYENEAARYQALVVHEDGEGNLLKTIKSIHPLHTGTEVADIGSGTGRVSFLLAPHVARVFGIEPSRGMREQAEALRRERGVANLEFREGGYSGLPLRDASVDLIVAGWSLGYYYNHFCRPDWEPKIDWVFREMRRILRPNGTIILIETLGTMEDQPMRAEWSWPLYDYFEHTLGFSLATIQTDFTFDSVAQAVDLIGFFFGEEMANEVWKRGRPVVPEWTGVWWKKGVPRLSF
jgi:SAM-dependent methyltransferase